ncbi:hypothetical protein T1K45_06955 [Lactiplantibacillus plantarum]|nr:hypothetical protein T1I15_01915 [Lactiplantibacillus plantarum]WRM18636.1 hypothetical protein T1K45_06955 [Lactiplantibacillus plantarum]
MAVTRMGTGIAKLTEYSAVKIKILMKAAGFCNRFRLFAKKGVY